MASKFAQFISMNIWTKIEELGLRPQKASIFTLRFERIFSKMVKMRSLRDFETYYNFFYNPEGIGLWTSMV